MDQPLPAVPQLHTAQDWEDRYKSGDLPWNAGTPDPNLAALFPALKLPAPVAVDLGCGTGDNAIFMARRGLQTTGVDIAATAIDMARAKAAKAGVANVRFVCADILQGLPVEPRSAGLVFDRGCFHTIPSADHPAFVRHVADALAPAGCWITLCGNADEIRPPGQVGPPQLTASQILAAATPLFELHHLERVHFHDTQGRSPLAWEAVFRKR